MEKKIFIGVSILLLVFSLNCNNDVVEQPAAPAAVIDGSIGDSSAGTAYRSLDTGRFNIVNGHETDSATVEIVAIDEETGVETTIGTGTVNPDGTFRTECTPGYSSFFVRVKLGDASGDGDNEIEVFVEENTVDGGTIEVEPVTDETDLSADIIRGEIQDGEFSSTGGDSCGCGTNDIRESITPEISELLAQVPLTCRPSALDGLRLALRESRRVFMESLSNTGVSPDALADVVSRISAAKAEIKVARKAMVTALRAAHDETLTLNARETMLREAREAFREQAQGIYESHGVPRELIARAEQMAHEALVNAFERGLFACAPRLGVQFRLQQLVRRAHNQSQFMIHIFSRLGLAPLALDRVRTAFKGFATAVEGIIFELRSGNVAGTEARVTGAWGLFRSAIIGNVASSASICFDELPAIFQALATFRDGVISVRDTLRLAVKTARSGAATDAPAAIKAAFETYEISIRTLIDTFAADAQAADVKPDPKIYMILAEALVGIL